MAFYRRLIGLDDPKIAIHQFMAAMAEFRRGRVTAAQIATAFNLDAAEQAEVTTLRARVTSDALTAAEIHDVGLLAESGLAYTTEAAMKTRFGV